MRRYKKKSAFAEVGGRVLAGRDYPFRATCDHGSRLSSVSWTTGREEAADCVAAGVEAGYTLRRDEAAGCVAAGVEAGWTAGRAEAANCVAAGVEASWTAGRAKAENCEAAGVEAG